ncbi:hypothetical protein E2C01_017123 [Portunus trituberculatus]|uniref:Uncharacterized protein n=1 Tax=Portunus trituberculatus TaxID=210409 RepID=A0A5B7DQR9_PORTR|nr:hypothetical protein [Portunus trituberculatus]
MRRPQPLFYGTDGRPQRSPIWRSVVLRWKAAETPAKKLWWFVLCNIKEEEEEELEEEEEEEEEEKEEKREEKWSERKGERA